MPIFEYVCEDCSLKFEQLVWNGDTKVTCHGCGGEKIRKLFSVFASTSGSPDFTGGSSFPEGSCGRCGSTERRCE